MAWRQPWDVVCPCCKVEKGRVCRSRITDEPIKDPGGLSKCHEARWNVSLGLSNPLGRGPTRRDG